MKSNRWAKKICSVMSVFSIRHYVDRRIEEIRRQEAIESRNNLKKEVADAINHAYQYSLRDF
jgi:hypothetical protein